MPATRRIGIIVPRGNVVHEQEAERLRPLSVEIRVLSFDYPVGAGDFCSSFTHCIAPLLEAMRLWRAEAVLLGCATATMMCATPEFDAALTNMAGAPVTTAARASKLAADALNVRRLAVASPYGESNNQIVRSFLEAQDLEIASLQGLGLDRDLNVWRTEAIPMSAEDVLALCLRVDRDAADAVYLPCTGVGSLDAIHLFESRTGKPAFSSVQAGFWATLQAAGIDGRQDLAGRLVRQWEF